MPRWRFLLILEESRHYQPKFNNQNHAIYWKIRLQICTILRHFVVACDRVRLMSADFGRQNIYHVRKPQNCITPYRAWDASFRMEKSNMGKVDKICQLYLQPLVKTFSLSRIQRTVIKIRQTRLTLCCAARDESERELRIISSVSYSFFFFFLV